MQCPTFTLLGVTALTVGLGASVNAAPTNSFWGSGGSGPNGPNSVVLDISVFGGVSGTLAPGSKLVGNDITFVPNPATVSLALAGSIPLPGGGGIPGYRLNSMPTPTGGNINGVPTKARTTIDPGTLDFLGVENLNMDLISGATPSPMNLAFRPVTLPIWITVGGTPVVPFPVTLLGNFSITEMKFFQSGPAVIGSGNTYEVPGQILAKGNAVVDGGLLGPILRSSFEFVENANLVGTATVTDQGSDNYKIEMDGRLRAMDSRLTLLLPLETEEALQLQVDDSVQNVFLTATVDVDANVFLGMSYHLEDVMTAPEPGTFILLGMGLAGLAPVVRRRLRNKKAA